MRERDLKPGERVMALLNGEGRERDVAAWEVCVDVVRSLPELYQPPHFAQPEGVDSNHISSLRGARDFDDLRSRAMVNGRSFGIWRNAVLDHEGERAKRLQTLGWVMQTLYRLSDMDSANKDVITPLAGKLGDFLWNVWEARDFRTDIDIRAWSLKAARCYDLLPKAWRFV